MAQKTQNWSNKNSKTQQDSHAVVTVVMLLNIDNPKSDESLRGCLQKVAGEFEFNCHVKFRCVKFQRCRKSRWNYTANVKAPRWRWNHGHHTNNAVFGLETISLGAALAVLQAAWHSSKTRSAECKKQELTTNRQHVPAHIGDCGGLFKMTKKTQIKGCVRFFSVRRLAQKKGPFETNS